MEFDASELDEIIHGRVRLGMLAYLATAERADFKTLKERLNVTDGNLGAHLAKLEAAGYVKVKRTIKNKKTQTIVSFSEEGRKAFLTYLDKIRALLNSTYSE